MKRVISVRRLSRSVIFQPLAAILTVFLLPFFSQLAGDTGVKFSEASAQVFTNQILQNVFKTTIASDLLQLESDGVNAYLALHDLPATDSSVIYNYGRLDLRSGIRGTMFNILLAIILKPASLRTAHEQKLYRWLQEAVQQNEIAEYTIALNQFSSLQRNLCFFKLDSELASEYELSYDGTPFCIGTSFAGLFSKPPVPAASYFTAYGLKFSYGNPALTYPYFPSLVSETGIDVALVSGIGAGIGAVVAGTGAALLAKSLSLALAAGTGAAGVAGKSAAFVLGGAAVSSLSSVVLVAAPAAIVLFAIAIGVAAGFQAFSSDQALNDLNNLNSILDQVTKTPPDLYAFAIDSSGLGMYKLQSTFDAQTVPEIPSTASLPGHGINDLNFAILESTATSPTISSTLHYEDWKGNDWSAQTYGGWFVQQCTSGENCSQSDSITGNLRFLDWSGTKWTASRLDNRFVVVKEKPASTDKECAPDAVTGVSPGTNFSTCSSYVSASIPLRDPNGVLETVSLSVLAPPVFTGPGTLSFTPRVVSSEVVATTGNPTPRICFFNSVPPLPSDFTLNGVSLSTSACAQGSFKLNFNGNKASPQQNYQLTLVASNGSSTTPVLGQFALDVSPHLGITTPASLTGTAGFPVNFLVETTGSPTPKLTIDPGVLVHGLSFKDNGNGTATISGTIADAANHRCLVFNGGPCGIRASNSQGTVIQALSINFQAAPRASVNPPTSATFITNAPNSVTLTSSGASTPVTWELGGPPITVAPPSWLKLTNNGDGTANLHGTPPANTTDTFTLEVSPVAFGSGPFFIFSPYSIDVLNVPVFLSSSTAAFHVGSNGLFTVRANQGSIGLVGTLPTGLSFSPGGTLDCLSLNTPYSACIKGTPPAGTAGQYGVVLTNDAGSAGSISQPLTLNVYQHPEITSSNMVTFITQTPSSFPVTTSGFPNTSTSPVRPNTTPPTGPNDGKGMFFTVRGLPSDLQFSNLNSAGFATGTLTIQGTPSSADVGMRGVQIAANNGVGTANQTILLNVLQLTAAVPDSGITCNGNYNGTYNGDLSITAGQNCTFVGGTINGSVQVNGGRLALYGTTVTNDVLIQGSSPFAIESGTTIKGTLFLQNIASGGTRNEICGSVVEEGLTLEGNSTPLQIGSFAAACHGNDFGYNVVVTNNRASMGIYNNLIGNTLSCSNDTDIIGQGNSAAMKIGQCATF
jgi:hypothetical protein